VISWLLLGKNLDPWRDLWTATVQLVGLWYLLKQAQWIDKNLKKSFGIKNDQYTDTKSIFSKVKLQDNIL
jgi:hypothetical protein